LYCTDESKLRRIVKHYNMMTQNSYKIDTKKKKTGSLSFLETTAIMEKARKFRDYASNAEAVLQSMEATRDEEEELGLSGLSVNKKKRLMILGGLIAHNLTSADETFTAIASQNVEKQNMERKRQQDYELGNQLRKIEADLAHKQGHSDADEKKRKSNVASLIGNTTRVADTIDETEEMITRLEAEEATDSDGNPHKFAERHPLKQRNKDGSSAKDNVLVVIISNRQLGIIPTIASILRTSSLPVDVVLIGEHEINERVRDHFGDRINDFTSMSVKDVEDDLVAQGYRPIWTWPEWHTSMEPSWKNENTLHVGSWDNLMTHAHVLNHIRFYLPLCSIFRGRPYFYFLDDDILIQRDLGVLASRTMHDLPPERGLVCACNIWMWNSGCFHFEFQSKKDYILSMPSLYGDREVCKTEFETHCYPDNYWDWVKSVLPEGGEKQHAWNFGFSLFGIDNWISNRLTDKYEAVMKASYDKHVFPETSLTFGLGVAYIAFAGAVECWNEEYVQVRDGFGFIEWDRYAKTFGNDFFNYVDVVHYTGPDKPWVDESRIEQRAIVPWLKMMEHEKMSIPKQLPLEPTNNLFTLLAGDRAGAQWIMSVLDLHPEVCASGEADKPETGFSADVLLPNGLPWYPTCSIKGACSLEFFRTHVIKLLQEVTPSGLPVRCTEQYNATNDEIVDHLSRMCNVVKRLNNDYTDGALARVWVDGFIGEDRSVTGCGCVRGVKAKGLKVLAEWITYRGYPGEKLADPIINLNDTKVAGSKIIRLKRHNTWARYKSLMMAVATSRYVLLMA
jgi:Glycosyl transferase family 8